MRGKNMRIKYNMQIDEGKLVHLANKISYKRTIGIAPAH